MIGFLNPNSMRMRIRLFLVLSALLLDSTSNVTHAASGPTLLDEIAATRAHYTADRQAFLTQALELDANQAATFWPLYEAYRLDMDRVGDAWLKLILEYADLQPSVPPDQAEPLLKGVLDAEQRYSVTRNKHFKKVSKKLPPATVLRWIQIENRLDLTLRLQLASQIPLMPGTGSKP